MLLRNVFETEDEQLSLDELHHRLTAVHHHLTLLRTLIRNLYSSGKACDYSQGEWAAVNNQKTHPYPLANQRVVSYRVHDNISALTFFPDTDEGRATKNRMERLRGREKAARVYSKELTAKIDNYET